MLWVASPHSLGRLMVGEVPGVAAFLPLKKTCLGPFQHLSEGAAESFQDSGRVCPMVVVF